MRSLFANLRRKEPQQPPDNEELSERCTVQVRVIEARGLMPMDAAAVIGLGSADPYVVLVLGDQKVKTTKQKNTLTPLWEQEFDFRGVPVSHKLVATCYDSDLITRDDPMGQVVIPTFEMSGTPEWYALQPTEGCDQPQGELRLACSAVLPPDSVAATKLRMHKQKMLLAEKLHEKHEREEREHDEAAGAGDDASEHLTEAELQARREEEEARLAEENADCEEQEARLAEEAAEREKAEAQAAQAEAQIQEEEARLAREKKLAEERDVIEARERLREAEAAGSEAEIAAARERLAREEAEAKVAAEQAAKEAQEAADAAAIADAEMAEAKQASELAAKEREEADAAREIATKERAEANAAAVAAALEKLEIGRVEGGGTELSRPSKVGGKENDNGDRVYRGKRSGGGPRPLSAPHEFTYYCGKAMPGGPLEPVQLAFEAAEAEYKRIYLDARDRVLQSDAGKAANGDEELIEPSTEVVLVGSTTVTVDGGVGVQGTLPQGLAVDIDEEQSCVAITNTDAPEEAYEVTVLVNPLKRLTGIERKRRRKAVAEYKKKLEVLQMEAAREWRRQPPGAKTVPGLNGVCGPYDGEQCPSCWRYQQALLRDLSHTKWRDSPAGRKILGRERAVLQQAYRAKRLEPRQTAQKVISQRRSRFDERAAFALRRRAARKDPMEQLQAAVDELLQLSGRIQKQSVDSLSGNFQEASGGGVMWKARWLQLIELPQGRERDGKRRKFGKPHQKAKPRYALEYRQHSNSPRALGVVPLDVSPGESIAGVSGLYKLILRAGPGGDRLLDLHAKQISRDAVAYAPFEGFVICGARDEGACKRKFWIFMSNSSKDADVDRAKRWYKGLVKLKHLENPQSAEMEARAEERNAAHEALNDAKLDSARSLEQGRRSSRSEQGKRNSASPSSDSSSSTSSSDSLSSTSYSDFAIDSLDSDDGQDAEARKQAGGPIYHLSIAVIECKNLPDADLVGKNDPYVTCSIGPNPKSHEVRKTRTCKDGGANPVWGGKGGGGVYASRGETLNWDLAKPAAQVILEVWDEDAGNPLDDDDLIGKVQISLNSSGEFGYEAEQVEPEAQWHALDLPGAENPGAGGAGEVRVALASWRQAGEAAGVGWERARHARTKAKVAAQVAIATAPARRDQENAARIAKGTVMRKELQEATARWEEKQREIEQAIAQAKAAAGVKVDPMGKQEGHPSFYQPPPRTLYAAQGYVKEARNNNQGAEIFEGGSALATGRHIRYANGELRKMLDEQLEHQLLERGATMWNSKAAGAPRSSTIRDKRLARITRGLQRIPDPYPEDDE